MASLPTLTASERPVSGWKKKTIRDTKNLKKLVSIKIHLVVFKNLLAISGIYLANLKKNGTIYNHPGGYKNCSAISKTVHQLLNSFINTTMPYKSSQFYNFAAQNIRHLSNVIKALNERWSINYQSLINTKVKHATFRKVLPTTDLVRWAKA